MRTRFLATDYFAPQSPIGTLRDFRFLPLPPLELPPFDPPLGVEIPFFDLDPRFPSGIDGFPIENALSQFLSDVIPRFHHAGEETSSDSSSRKGELQRFKSGSAEIGVSESQRRDDGFWEEENWESWEWFRDEAYGVDVLDEVVDSIHEEKAVEKCSFAVTKIPEHQTSKLQKELRFEIVEVDLPLRETVSSYQAEKAGFCFEIPDIKIPLDVIDIEVGVTITHPIRVAKSIYSVEEISAKLNDDQESFSVKHGSSCPDRTLNQSMRLPQFELCENGWELDESISTTEALDFLLPMIEPWHEPQDDGLVANAKEFLGSADIDLLEHFSRDAPSQDCPGHKPMSLNSLLEMDYMNISDNMLLEGSSAIYQIAPDGSCSYSPYSVRLQEVQIFDFPTDDVFQMFVNSQTAKKFDLSEQAFKDETDLAESLYESVVSSELALVDDAFKSLPTPILFDDKVMKSLPIIVGDTLRALEPHSLTACDGIYLDWHLLLEGMCNREICSTYMGILEEINCDGMTSELQIESQGMIAIDIDFLDDFQESVNTLHCHEVPTDLHTGVTLASNLSSKAELTQTLSSGNYETSSSENKGLMPKMNSERISFLFESMSQSSDLNFFLDVRRGTARMNSEDGTMKRVGSKITQPVVSLKEQSIQYAIREEKCGKWDIEIHQIRLSDHILGLIDHIHNSYLAILDENAFLREKRLFKMASSEVLSLPKQKLLELISEKFASQCTLGSKDEDVMALVEIYALKQLAYYLCLFGVHAAYLYLCNLTQSIDYMAEKLRCLKSLIEDVHWKADKQLIESHPLLSHIESVLTSNIKNKKKMLIVTDRVFWLPLAQKLISMRIKYHEVRHFNSPAKQFGSLDNIEFTNSVLEGLLHSECLLICHENVSPSFPFNKFSIILEYGGPYGSSRLSSICPNLGGLPQLHFFHVNLENHDLPASLCEGFVSQHPKSATEADPEFMPNLQKVLNSQHILEILNFVPTEEQKSCVSSESANQVDVSHDIDSVNVPYPMRTKTIDSVMPSFPDVIIIVNTQSYKKKMLMSRRTSYQKILAMEKGGVQVVERDIDLPLDLIFSAAVCLVWYEARNLGDNVSLTVETSSIPTLVENIATNILVSLSFAFSSCILIFEGETNFLAAIMESSDALYAAAASLDMNLQLFCSYMPESTDEIILNCIRNVTKLSGGLYPTMPESETLGESFLTRFPSINPLSAHAILSSGGTLVEFLEWSPEHRIRAIGKYHVSNESISLFSTLCRYGEMGESKSVMTECSSIDSDISSRLLQSPRKRRRNASRTFSMPINNFIYDVPQNETIHEMMLPQAFKPHQLRNFSNVQNKLKKTGGHSLGKRQAVNTSRVSNNDGNDNVGREYLNEDFSDEVIDHEHTLDEMFPCKSKTSSFLRRSESRSEPAIRSFLPTIREAFVPNSHCTFPTSSEINHVKNKWTSLKDQNLTLDDKIFKSAARDSSKNDIRVKQREYLKEDIMQNCTRNILGLSTRETLPPLNGKTPYPSAKKSPRSQRGPGWTIEFLPRVKEKSRGHHQTLSCNTCVNCTRSLKRKETPSKSQSLSIFECYKYQGGNQTKKTVDQKWRKDIKVQLNSNNEEKKSSLISPTWTPIDKRARLNLSFMRNGKEKQSKLVWRNRNSPTIDCNLRKRYREEGTRNEASLSFI